MDLFPPSLPTTPSVQSRWVWGCNSTWQGMGVRTLLCSKALKVSTCPNPIDCMENQREPSASTHPFCLPALQRWPWPSSQCTAQPPALFPALEAHPITLQHHIPPVLFSVALYSLSQPRGSTVIFSQRVLSIHLYL